MKGLLQIEYVTSMSCIAEPAIQSRDTATLVLGYLFWQLSTDYDMDVQYQVRVRSFGTIRISDPWSLMLDQMNWWIHSGQGFIGLFNLSWSEWCRHWSWSGSSQRNALYVWHFTSANMYGGTIFSEPKFLGGRYNQVFYPWCSATSISP